MADSAITRREANHEKRIRLTENERENGNAAHWSFARFVHRWQSRLALEKKPSSEDNPRLLKAKNRQRTNPKRVGDRDKQRTSVEKSERIRIAHRSGGTFMHRWQLRPTVEK